MADEFNGLKHITWRGHLSSCNYTCSYCPFAKKQSSEAELNRDSEALLHFKKFLTETEFKENLSVLIVPYGEAMIHKYYWEYFSDTSKNNKIDMISCQTNLSFNEKEFILYLRQNGADFSKISLWASFHPENISVKKFAEQVSYLSQYIKISVGAVGDPHNIEFIKELKSLLPPNIYLWINAMDGLKRKYTKLETEEFCELDALFNLELKKYKPEYSLCSGGRKNIFVDATGNIYPCNRNNNKVGNIYTGNMRCDSEGQCKGKCDCFLSYSFRKDLPELLYLGAYPQLRNKNSYNIKALFFDIDGTITDDRGLISLKTKENFWKLSEKYKLYPVTALTRDIALQRLKHLYKLISGGIFAYGADIYDSVSQKEILYKLPNIVEDSYKPDLYKTYKREDARKFDSTSKKSNYLYKTYEREDIIYKQVFRKIPSILPVGTKMIKEGSVISLIEENVSKLSGIKEIMQWNNWTEEEILVIGNSFGDIEMLAEFPLSFSPLNINDRMVFDSAKYNVDINNLLEFL